ncbi:hypothetical protein [Mucilaginibacter lappiensis]|uniref:hypothetical protein n=1 Tax=Mucilaginibacter lappiensis TaxID=354630 RepID=UPI003D1E1D3B
MLLKPMIGNAGISRRIVIISPDVLFLPPILNKIHEPGGFYLIKDHRKGKHFISIHGNNS